MPELADVEKQLRTVDVIASSIPHFLHWDVAYLWMLECQPNERSGAWTERIQAWKRLVALFLLGKLELKTSGRLREHPFSEFAERLEIEELTWVCAQGRTEPLGVLSPTVLVRPLPDFKAKEDLPGWPADPNEDKGMQPLLRHFVALAAEELKKKEGIPQRLAKILLDNFNNPSPGEPQVGKWQPVCVLRTIQWIPAPLDTTELSLLVCSHERRHFVPVCSRGHAVTHAQIEEAVPVPMDQAAFVVRCPQCNMDASIQLRDLMIWQQGGEVVVWEDRKCLGLPFSLEEAKQVDETYPPDARVQGKTVTFEWMEGEAPRERRFLKLEFRDRDIRSVSFDQIRFHSVLVIGSREQFIGMPIRPEWCKLVEEVVKEKEGKKEKKKRWSGPEWVGNHAKYKLTLRGWPFGFEYYAVAIQGAPNLFAGIYPDYIPGWKQYRAFVVGENHQDYILSAHSGAGADGRRMPWCLQREGWGGPIGVVKEADRNVGTTFDVVSPPDSNPEGTAELFLGIDFGTSNSLVYFAEEDDLGRLEASEHAVRPGDLVKCVKALAGDLRVLEEVKGGGFLPPAGRTLPQKGDDYLVPSAYWAGGDFPVIRWRGQAPFAGAVARHGFKWDTSAKNFSQERKAYLQELLFLVVPYAVKQKIAGRTARLDVGWAFPLAFGHAQRKSMNELLGQLGDQMKEQMGIEAVGHYTISESRANVRGFGQPTKDDTYLVADMGGGTLDLALFTYRGRDHLGPKFDYHDIGSLRFAGESYLECVLRREEIDVDLEYWRYRDSIQGLREESTLRGDPVAQTALDQFATMAFEFLRTMYMALGGNNGRRVELVLAGNGWRLIEAVSAQTPKQGPRKVFDQFYQTLGGKMTLPQFAVRSNAVEPALRKHYVVQGALQNAQDKHNELDDPNAPGSKLPAGRKMEFSFQAAGQPVTVSIGWQQAVGDDPECSLQWSTNDLMRESISIDLQSGPARSTRWEQHWDVTFGGDVKPPEEQKMRNWLCQTLRQAQNHILKGPLQLLMEYRWLEFLRTGK